MPPHPPGATPRALCSVTASTAASPRPGSGKCRAGPQWWPGLGLRGFKRQVVKRRMGGGSWLSPLGAVTPGAPHTLSQPPQPILAKEQTSKHVMPWALRKPCLSPGLSFPIGKAERGKPRLGTRCPPAREELGRAPRVLGTERACAVRKTDAPPPGDPGVCTRAGAAGPGGHGDPRDTGAQSLGPWDLGATQTQTCWSTRGSKWPRMHRGWRLGNQVRGEGLTGRMGGRLRTGGSLPLAGRMGGGLRTGGLLPPPLTALDPCGDAGRLGQGWGGN